MSTISEFRASQRQDRVADREQRREDRRLADEAQLERQRLAQEAEDRRREQDRLDREQQAREKLAREESARAAKEKEAKEVKRAKERAAEKRRERRARAVKAAPAWIAEHLDLAGALAVMACSIVPALVSQASSLRDTGIVESMGWLGVLLVALLPVMLECSAWAATAGEAKAMKAKRNPWPYRIAIYSFAGLAAWVNYLHGRHVGGEQYGLLLGSVLAASSIIPIAVWQLVQLGRHREFKEERRAERAARKAAQHVRKQRKRLYPDVWHLAVQLRSIAGVGLSEDDAFQAAYGVIEGTGVELDRDLLMLLSAEQLDLMARSEERLGEVLGRLHTARTRRAAASARLAEAAPDGAVKTSTDGALTPSTQTPPASVMGLVDPSGKPLVYTQSSQITPSIPPSTRARKTAPAPARKSRPEAPARTLSKGARKSARQTAKEAAKDAAKTERAAVEDWVRGRLATTGEITWQAVRDETHRRRLETDEKAQEPSRAWCYSRITAAKSGVRLAA
ncbi:hypothetical protein ACXZ65_34325 [Streptomyces aculeolatus]